MKRIVPLVVTIVMGTRCAGMPELRSVSDAERESIGTRCSVSFITKSTRFIHSIEAALPNGSKGNLIGVTLAYPEQKTIHCALMSLEGLVLFEAEKKEHLLSVHKAIAPFDRMGFAEGLMEDIELVYFRPDVPVLIGAYRDESLCRYQTGSGVVDCTLKGDKGWEIRKYSSSGKMIREVIASDIGKDGLPSKIRLRAPGLLGYSLILSLIESESLDK